MAGPHVLEYTIVTHKDIKKSAWCMILHNTIHNYQMENILCYPEHSTLSLSDYPMDLP